MATFRYAGEKSACYVKSLTMLYASDKQEHTFRQHLKVSVIYVVISTFELFALCSSQLPAMD
jgi:hypothetical protein